VIREFAPQSTTVYINYEQSQKPANDNELEQGRIHNAFRTPPRTFGLVYRFTEGVRLYDVLRFPRHPQGSHAYGLHC
jgi:hypothetical protein